MTEASSISTLAQTVDGNFDPHLRLFNEQGVVWAQNDDGSLDEGSVSGLDSLLDFTFFEPGRYAIEVGSCCVDTVPAGATYQLHISIENHALLQNKEVDLVTTGSTWEILGSSNSARSGLEFDNLRRLVVERRPRATGLR